MNRPDPGQDSKGTTVAEVSYRARGRSAAGAAVAAGAGVAASWALTKATLPRRAREANINFFILIDN